MTDMEHMRHIDAIAASDCDVLREKESTYRGSWKAAGGRSAWFMMRRNMDRLLTMMRPPSAPDGWSIADYEDCVQQSEEKDKKSQFGDGDVTVDHSIARYLLDSYVAEDIFAKIEQNQSGDDGTVLACLRDLRRYLLLIEAEMAARGMVATGLFDTPPVTIRHVDGVNQNKTEPEAVLRRHEFCHNMTQDTSSVVSEIETREYHRVGEVEMSTTNIKREYSTPSCGDGLFDDRQRQRTPEDGAQHASTYPWLVNSSEYDKLVERHSITSMFYEQLESTEHVDLYRLREYVAVRGLPVELRTCYQLTPDTKNWRLAIESCPPDARHLFLNLPERMTQEEHDARPSWQHELYMWIAHEQKYQLKSQHEAWHVKN